jgi:hypothetical protein
MKLTIGAFDTQIQLDDSEVDKYCGIGTSDCCIFLSNGSNCERWNSAMSMTILDRYEKGFMNATRKGCDTVNNLDITEAYDASDANGVVFVFPDMFKE